MLVPRMTPKDLFDAEPGELVRTGGRNEPILGLVSGLHYDDPRIWKLLICLTPLAEDRPAPSYIVIHERSGSAISFGKDYLFVGDPSADAIDPHWHGGFYAAGALIVGVRHKLLQVVPAYPEAHHAILSYDIDAGRTVDVHTPTPNCVLLKWEIRLRPYEELDPPLAPLFCFEMASRSAG
jgi:hypothetical protein